ncbi:MAG: C69 family dipeptidase [Rhizobium sp.]|nr:C69 family dipeptidase [Rhizobium sp.]
MSYGLYIGRNHAGSGHAWLAGYGDEPSSHWLEVVPRNTHAPGTTISVGVTPQARLPGELSSIPQVPETARHVRVSYSHYLGVPAPLTNGGLNEFGVAVRDIWSPSRAELIDMTPANQKGPNYSDLSRIVLERARTAREGVDIIADLIAEHGYSCYGGNSHILADPDEAWVVIEFSGGLGLWVAERLGPDSIRASRPGYMGDIPQEPNEDFLFPDHFIRTASGLGWYAESNGLFNVNAVYGDGKGQWAGQAWIEEEMRCRAARPQKIGFADVVWAIATERLTGDTAGYGQIVPLVHPSHDSLRVMWHAPVGPVAAPLVPVFMGMTDVPAEYAMHRYLTDYEASRFQDMRKAISSPEAVSQVPQGVEISRSAVQIFRQLMHAAFQDGGATLLSVSDIWRAFEADVAAELPAVLRSAEILIEANEADLAARLLTDFSHTRLRSTLTMAEPMLRALEVKLTALSRLNMTTSHTAPGQIW